MYLTNIIINNFVEAIEEEDLMIVESMEDEIAYQHLARLYERTYGAEPSGVAVYLLRSKFKIGKELENRAYLPAHL
jgi:hypothetical protein